MSKTIFICEIQYEGRGRLLTREPLEFSAAETAMAKLAAAEKILPEGSRRQLFTIDLEDVMPKPEPLANEGT